MAEPARKCTICKKTKPESQFKVRKGEYTNQCKQCINEQSRQYNKRDTAKEATNKRVQRYYENNPEKRKENIAKSSEVRRKRREK